MQLAFLTNINPTELVLIAVVAVLIFGRRLPEVAGRAAGHVQRARRALTDLKRESGLDEELRTAREAMREVSNPSLLTELPKLPSPSTAIRRVLDEPTPEPPKQQPPTETDSKSDGDSPS